MKFLMMAFVAIAGHMASANCLGEAQIIAKVQGNSKTMVSCLAYIDPTSVIQYNTNQVCPLDLDEVLINGIEVGLKDGHDCRLQAGDIITGVLVKTASGSIVLE